MLSEQPLFINNKTGKTSLKTNKSKMKKNKLTKKP